MEQFDPTASYEARRDFYRQMVKDPDFQALKPEDRQDVARKILFPPERPIIGGPGTGEPSPTGLKIAAATEPVVRGLARLAPFPGAIKALTTPETVPEEQRSLGYLVNPLPEVATQVFQDVVGGVRSTLGHEPAKLIEDVAGSAPFLPLQRLGQIARTIPRYFRKTPTPDWEWLKTREALTERRALPAPEEPVVAPAAPPVEPTTPPPPLRPQPSPPEIRLAEVSGGAAEAEARALLRTPEGRLELMRQRLAARAQPTEAVTPEVIAPTRKPPVRAGRGPRKTTIQAPVAPPVMAQPDITGPLPDPIQERLTAMGIEVPRAETQPPEGEAPAVKAAKAPETTERLTIREAAKKTESLIDPIVGAAYRVGGRIFSGVTHMEADMAAEKAGFPIVTDRESGFVTKSGKFLNPEEARVYVNKTPETYQELPETLTAKEIVTKIKDQQDPEHFDKPKITKQVEKGKVIDGRHRTVDAKQSADDKAQNYIYSLIGYGAPYGGDYWNWIKNGRKGKFPEPARISTGDAERIRSTLEQIASDSTIEAYVPEGSKLAVPEG